MSFAPSKQILVIDDDVLVLRLVREALEALLPECAVDTTTNPEYGFELLLRKPYDLLLLDFMMEGIDGAALYGLITKVFTIHPPDGRHLPPMILLSGAASHKRAQELLRSPGVRGHLSKPFSIERLVEKVTAALG